MYPELKSKVVIVTGAGGHLGRAIAMSFAGAGARVAAVDIDLQAATTTSDLVRGAGAEAKPFQANMAQAASVEQAFRHAADAFGDVDILVNNAGIAQAGRPFLADVPEDLFDRIVGVNLKGVWLGMRSVLPSMAARGAGCIVNVASVLGLVAEQGMGIYAASKHGVLALTKAAALEYGPQGVRINAVCPSRQEGAMQSGTRGTTTEAEKLAGDKFMNPASGRAGRPDELAATIQFLCSNGAAGIHGAAMAIDGGYTAR